VIVLRRSPGTGFVAPAVPTGQTGTTNTLPLGRYSRLRDQGLRHRQPEMLASRQRRDFSVRPGAGEEGRAADGRELHLASQRRRRGRQAAVEIPARRSESTRKRCQQSCGCTSTTCATTACRACSSWVEYPACCGRVRPPQLAIAETLHAYPPHWRQVCGLAVACRYHGGWQAMMVYVDEEFRGQGSNLFRRATLRFARMF
jgi:hypothetical protein